MLSREDFFGWCKKYENLLAFMGVYAEWVENDFNEYYSPSIDRKDPKRGYALDNIQWMSTGENTEKAGKEGNGDADYTF